MPVVQTENRLIDYGVGAFAVPFFLAFPAYASDQLATLKMDMTVASAAKTEYENTQKTSPMRHEPSLIHARARMARSRAKTFITRKWTKDALTFINGDGDPSSSGPLIARRNFSSPNANKMA